MANFGTSSTASVESDATVRALATAHSILKSGGTKATAETAAYCVLTADAEHAKKSRMGRLWTCSRRDKLQQEAKHQARAVVSIAVVATRTKQDKSSVSSIVSSLTSSNGSKSGQSPGFRTIKQTKQKRPETSHLHKYSQMQKTRVQKKPPDDRLTSHCTDISNKKIDLETAYPIPLKEASTVSNQESVGLNPYHWSEDEIKVVRKKQALSEPQSPPMTTNTHAAACGKREFGERSFIDPINACSLPFPQRKPFS